MKVSTFLNIIDKENDFMFEVIDTEGIWEHSLSYDELERKYLNREIIHVAPNEDYFYNLAFSLYIK